MMPHLINKNTCQNNNANNQQKKGTIAHNFKHSYNHKEINCSTTLQHETSLKYRPNTKNQLDHPEGVSEINEITRTQGSPTI